ncbi:hypothetical protein HN51_040395 [Arachis hypogaea]
MRTGQAFFPAQPRTLLPSLVVQNPVAGHQLRSPLSVVVLFQPVKLGISSALHTVRHWRPLGHPEACLEASNPSPFVSSLWKPQSSPQICESPASRAWCTSVIVVEASKLSPNLRIASFMGLVYKALKALRVSTYSLH